MRRIVIVLLVVVSALCYWGIAQYVSAMDKAVNDNIVHCIKGFGKGNFLEPNAQKFCSCNAEFLRANPFADREDAAVKAEIGSHVRNCMDTHNKQTILAECGKMNDKMIAADGAYYIECACFYDALVNPMLEQWQNGKLSTAELEKNSKKIAVDSLNACMKMR